MTLTDAGSLIALIDGKQAQSPLCRSALTTLSLPLLTTWPAFAEAMYLLGRIGGWPLQLNLWLLVEDGTLVLHAPTADEHLRMKTLMEQYRDRPMDLADASLVAAAETRGDNRVFTIDADFFIYQLNGRQPFEVVP